MPTNAPLPAEPAREPTRFVLVQPSHPGNVGAAARAMKVMGFTDLVLVLPRFGDVLSREDAVAMASGAADILVRARIVSTLRSAAGVTCLRHRDDPAISAAHLAAARAPPGAGRQRPARGFRVRPGTHRAEQ
jgi:tRNA C32,U32 (ribose-2'-O)-methylase TrmJ